MTSLLDLVAPVFGLVALGFIAVRSSVLDTGGVRGLVAFVFNFALPVLLFRTMAGMEIPEHIPWSVLVAFYVPALTIYAVGMALARWGFGRPMHEQAIFGMAASFSNTVFLGIPIALPALGPEAALPVLLIVAFHSATFMPLTLALVYLGRGKGVSAPDQAATLARSLVKDPIVMGILVGLAANLGSAALPGWLDRLAELLATAAMPCALFAMGASLAGSPAGADGTAPWTLAALKTVAHPLLVWVLAVPVLGLRGVWADAAVLMAAMPTGVNVYLFAARHDAAAPVAARTVLVATVASVATISAVLALLGG